MHHATRSSLLDFHASLPFAVMFRDDPVAAYHSPCRFEYVDSENNFQIDAARIDKHAMVLCHRLQRSCNILEIDADLWSSELATMMLRLRQGSLYSIRGNLWDNSPKRSRTIRVAFFPDRGMSILLVRWQMMLPHPRIRTGGRDLRRSTRAPRPSGKAPRATTLANAHQRAGTVADAD
jgi:hypothetical protein